MYYPLEITKNELFQNTLDPEEGDILNMMEILLGVDYIKYDDSKF